MKRRDVLKGGLAFSAAAVAAPYVKAQAQITLQRRLAVQRRPRLHQGDGEVRRADAAVLRQADRLRPAQELRARAREALFRLHDAGHRGRLRHRVAGPHVDLLEGRAVHRRAVPVPRPRPLEQGARQGHPQAGRRRDRAEGRRHADRLCRRRRAQHLLEQAGDRRSPSCKGLKVRVQGAPIWSKTFAAIGMSPTVIAYNEVYNAIQNGVINAGENEAAGVESMKFFEVGPNLLDDRARDHHPAAVLLGQDLQAPAARAAGRRSSRPARRAARTAGRSSRPRTRRSSTRSRRPAS